MSQLTKELNAATEKKKIAISGDALVLSATKLIAESSSKDVELLKELGLDHQIKVSEQKQQISNEIAHYSEKYNSEVYNGADIKNMCNIYDLRILSIDKYNGSIPPDLASAIRRFHESNNLVVKRSQLFILAPTEQFKTVDYVKPVPPQAIDPVVLYLERDATWRDDPIKKSDNLIKVHEWGNDFTKLRYFKHFANSHEGKTVLPLLLIAVFFALVSAIGFGFAERGVAISTGIISGIFAAISIFLIPYEDNWNTDIKG